MVEESYPQDQVSYELALKLRDLQEGQKLMKERLLLIGQNLLEAQEKNNTEITELKKQIYNLETDLKRARGIIETLSEELSKTARKEEIAILHRQFKIFEPLEFARIEDVEKIVDEKLNKHKKHSSEEENPHHFWAGKL